MIHKPIQIKDLCLSFPHKICFQDFNNRIPHGSRIAIIGRNGSGKTTLLNLLNQTAEPSSGEVKFDNDTVIGFVPQIIEEFALQSGGQRLNQALTKALNCDPNVLLLDEPTNHLDKYNRQSLMRMLQSYSGTLIVVSHDVELLRHCIDTIWHIDNGEIHVFDGAYDDYIQQMQQQRRSIEEELSRLNNQTKELHNSLMKEQKRASKSKMKGQKSILQKKWPTIVSNAKLGRAEETSGQKKSAIDNKKSNLSEKLQNLRLPEMIVPKFHLKTAQIGERTIVTITQGRIGYADKIPLLQKNKFQYEFNGKSESSR